MKEMLNEARRIAILGLSPKEERISNAIARFLVASGREIVPINPGHPEILGQTSYPDLKSVPGDVDLAVVFRAPKFADEVLADAKASGVNRVWFQPGAFDDDTEVDGKGLDIYFGS